MTQRLDINAIAAMLEFVIHIERAHHANIHIDELGGEIEIAFEIRGVDDIDDHVGHLLRQVFADIEFLW